jgi:hypothetical protein
MMAGERGSGIISPITLRGALLGLTVVMLGIVSSQTVGKVYVGTGLHLEIARCAVDDECCEQLGELASYSPQTFDGTKRRLLKDSALLYFALACAAAATPALLSVPKWLGLSVSAVATIHFAWSLWLLGQLP